MQASAQLHVCICAFGLFAMPRCHTRTRFSAPRSHLPDRVGELAFAVAMPRLRHICAVATGAVASKVAFGIVQSAGEGG